MDTYSKTFEERIDWVFELARTHSEEYCSPEATLARQRYLVNHPTAIMVLKCMDGRLQFPLATHTPLGLIQPFRNLGGRFNLGWPYLGEVLADHVREAVAAGRQVLFFITYHYSRSSAHRGCAGFGYDTDAAMAHTREIKDQMEVAFGSGHGTVYPLICGFETDEDALVLHGDNGEVLNMAELTAADRDDLPRRLEALFPTMAEQIRADLLPLLHGNLERIAEVRTLDRTLDIEHREWMLCVGRGFDFLHTPNQALIIGPYSPDLADPIRKAAGIIEDNMRSGRIPDDGLLLLSSAPYREIGVGRARAQLKSRFLSGFVADVIRNEFPALAEKMTVRTAVLNKPTQRLELLEETGE